MLISSRPAAVQNCDMPEEMRQDCVDLVITAIEKFQGNYEVRARTTHAAGQHARPAHALSSTWPAVAQSAARLVKETMDKKYNESWVVIIGQGFAFEVTHEVKHVLWMFLSDLSALVYKGAPTRPLQNLPLRRRVRPRSTPSPERDGSDSHSPRPSLARHGSWCKASRSVIAAARRACVCSLLSCVLVARLFRLVPNNRVKAVLAAHTSMRKPLRLNLHDPLISQGSPE